MEETVKFYIVQHGIYGSATLHPYCYRNIVYADTLAEILIQFFMEKPKSPEIKKEFIKVDTYKGYDVYTWSLVMKEHVANMMPDSNNIAVAIAIHPNAYEILKSRPDYLQRIYDHELQHNVTEDAEHGNDNDILEFLRDNGYDFGDFKI